MNILIITNSVLPISLYGGTQRVIWYLAQALNQIGHKVTLLAPQGTECPFAQVIIHDLTKEIDEQIPENIDVVHFHFAPMKTCKPYLITVHGNVVNEQMNCISKSRQ